MVSDPEGKPQIGRSANRLGVRVPVDIKPDSGGDVHPETGGMSVSPDSFLNIPNYRRPKRIGHGSTGPDSLRIYAIGKDRVSIDNLHLRPDPVRIDKHAFVEPSRVMQLTQYENALGSTKDDWKQI